MVWKENENKEDSKVFKPRSCKTQARDQLSSPTQEFEMREIFDSPWPELEWKNDQSRERAWWVAILGQVQEKQTDT